MNKLMSSVMRGIGKKRKLDDGSDSDDEEWSPDSRKDFDDDASPKKRKKPRKAASSKAKKKTGTKALKSAKVDANKNGNTETKLKAVEKEKPSKLRRQPSGEVGLLNMPTDVLIRIVQLLTADQGILVTARSLSPVCRFLHQLISCQLPNYLWHCADLRQFSRKISLPLLHSIVLPRFPGLVSLKLQGLSQLRDKDIEDICSVYGQTLSEVSLSGSSHLSAKSVVSLSEGCRELRVVALSQLPHRVARGQVLSQLIKRHSGTLVSLSLDSLQGEIVGFGALLAQLTSSDEILKELKSLRLANLRSSSYRDAAVNLAGLSQCAPVLKRLELSNLGLTTGLEFVPPLEFVQLNHLAVQELQSPSVVRASPATLPNLVSLCVVAADFEICKEAGKECDSADEWFSRLSRLTLSHCPNAQLSSIRFLFRSVESLTDIDFSYSGGDLDLELRRPNPGTPVINSVNLVRLKRLNLAGTNVDLHGARHILFGQTSLSELNLTACKNLPRGFKQHLTSRSEIDAWLARTEQLLGEDDNSTCD